MSDHGGGRWAHAHSALPGALPRIRLVAARDIAPLLLWVGDPRKLLQRSLDDRWKTFRKRLKRGIPARDDRRTEEAVHDLRTASRRLLSLLDCIRILDDAKPVRRLSRRVDRVLSRLGSARDLSVERHTLSISARRARAPALKSFLNQLEREYRRELRRSQRDLDRVDVRDLTSQRNRIRKALAHLPGPRKDVHQKLLRSARDALDRVREKRAAIDPHKIQTLHHTRIAVKNFRYLLEAIAPEVPGASPKALATLRALQTSLGDLHDLEVLTAALSRYSAGHATSRIEDLTPVLIDLEAQHSGILRSFFKSVDAILDYWTRVLPEK